MEKPEDDKKDQEVVKSVPAVDTKKTEETEFNVRQVCRFL